MMLTVMSLYGIGYGLLFPSISALLVDSTTTEEYGRATGLFHALITVGVSVGAPVIGWSATFWGIKTGLSLSSAILFVVLGLATLTLVKGRTIKQS